MTTILHFVTVPAAVELGWARLDGDQVSASDDTVRHIFERFGGLVPGAFDLLADGWSNGYVKIVREEIGEVRRERGQ